MKKRNGWIRKHVKREKKKSDRGIVDLMMIVNHFFKDLPKCVYCKIELPKVADGNWRMLHLQIGESCKTFAKSSQERCSA